MRLYNLTYENDYLVSNVKPVSLPENNYTLVEIVYMDNIIYTIKGTYKYETHKECILSNLDISAYTEKLKDIQNKDKIYINYRENILDENERIMKIFITLLSSYLIYFNFLEFPYETNLDLLTNKMFIYFTSFSPMNLLEESFMKQVSLFHRFFSNIFSKEEKDLHDEIDKLVQEVQEYKRKFLKDIDIKEIKKEIYNIKKKLK